MAIMALQRLRFFSITNEEAIIERSRLLLVAYGLLSPRVNLTPLPKDHPFRRHEGSQASYLVEQEVFQNVVYVSKLPPKSKTTAHSHHGRKYEHQVFENYVCVEGEVTIILDDSKKRVLREGQKFQVWPGVKHQIKTSGNSAILAIVLENGARYPRAERHLK